MLISVPATVQRRGPWEDESSTGGPAYAAGSDHREAADDAAGRPPAAGTRPGRPARPRPRRHQGAAEDRRHAGVVRGGRQAGEDRAGAEGERRAELKRTGSSRDVESETPDLRVRRPKWQRL